MAREVNPNAPTINDILSYLTSLYNDGMSYSSIGTARSALSNLIHIPGISAIGEHPLVKRLMRGIYNNRPPLPKYSFIWDTKILINYFRTMNNEELTFKLLTMKAVTLITLLTGQRVSTIRMLKLSDMFLSADAVIFSISGLLKHSKPGKQIPPVKLGRYVPDRNLCPVLTLNSYLTQRNAVVGADVQQVFVTYGKPHHPASKDTLARWIKDMFTLAGIDINMFKPHSCRAASTSKAGANGVPVESILNSAQWANDCVYYKHYCKTIVNAALDPVFQNSILEH